MRRRDAAKLSVRSGQCAVDAGREVVGSQNLGHAHRKTQKPEQGPSGRGAGNSPDEDAHLRSKSKTPWRACARYADEHPTALTPLGAEARHDLLEILEERYGRHSTIVTSQLPVEQWHQVIGDPTYADAILDRLVHNAHRIELAGESLRKTRARAAKRD
jgi:hypothetical protein